LSRVATGSLAVWLQRRHRRVGPRSMWPFGPLLVSCGKRCPRQESNLVSDLRKVVCGSGTLRGRMRGTGISAPKSPARGSNPALRLRRPPCARHTHGDALARSRTWSTTFGGSCAIPSHSKGHSIGRAMAGPSRPATDRSPDAGRDSRVRARMAEPTGAGLPRSDATSGKNTFGFRVARTLQHQVDGPACSGATRPGDTAP
jgi:hypothetical protein